MSEGQKRAAIYVRVSTRGQEEDGSSLDTQEKSCRAYCAEHGYDVLELFSDTHSGGDLHDRRALGRLREAVRGRQVDVVVAHCVDRLSRSQTHWGVLLDEFERNQCAIEFATEVFENTALGKFLLSAKSFAAEVEREKAKERTKRGLVARVEAGKPLPGSQPKYGYEWIDPERKAKTRYRISDTTGPIVRRIFRQAAESVSIREIANRLTADGVPPPSGRGTVWRHSTVHHILTNRAYTGEAIGLRYVRKIVDGKRRFYVRPESEQIALPDGTVPALIDIATFESVQARLATNKLEATRNNKHPEDALLRAGYVRCGHCGYSMTFYRPPDSRPLYRCVHYREKGDRCPSPASIPVAEMDTAVWERLRRILKTPELIDAELHRTAEQDPTVDDLGAIDRRLAEIERRRRNIAGNIALLDPDSAEALREQLVGLMAQYKALLDERQVVLARQEAWQAARQRLHDLQAWCRKIGEKVDSATYEYKRLALEAFGIQATVWRPGHELRYDIRSNIDLDAIVADARPGIGRAGLTLGA